MGRPKLDTESKAVGVYLPQGILARWQAVAKAEDRTTSYVMRRALLGALPEAERRAARTADVLMEGE